MFLDAFKTRDAADIAGVTAVAAAAAAPDDELLLPEALHQSFHARLVVGPTTMAVSCGGVVVVVMVGVVVM